jgi:hypothetical protein
MKSISVHLWAINNKIIAFCFFMLSHKDTILRKKLLNIKCIIFIFSKTFIWDISHSTKNSARYYPQRTFLILQRIQRDITLNGHFSFHKEFSEILPSTDISLHVEYPIFLSDFNEAKIFSTRIWKFFKYQFERISFQASRGVTCGRTDTMKLTVAFRKVANAPNATVCYI